MCITWFGPSFAHLAAQEVTSEAPPAETMTAALPDAPGAHGYPDAVPVATKDEGMPFSIESDVQTRTGSHSIARGHVVVTYENRTLQADEIDYDSETDEVVVTGHVVATGGENDEHILASHGTINLKTQKGRFYDVTGSVGMKSLTPKPGAERMVYSNGNPFLFTGRMVVKTGPHDYEVYDGTVTSCALPKPDWLLSAAKFTMDGDKARAKNSVFHVMSVPLVYLPYVTHPVDANDRQSGILIPTIGFGSASKGDTVGEQVYWSMSRSADLTLGTVYYSARGWSENGSFRYRGQGQDLAKFRFSALQDRGYTPSGGAYINQSGTEATFTARRDYGVATRGVIDVDYLSSFLYREGFTDNFNQAISSDILSSVYATHAWNGMAVSVEGDRYQGEKRVASTSPSGVVTPEQEVHIFHAPAVEFTTTDHRLGSTGLEWSLDSSAAALKRSQPNFVTSGMIERLDLRPELAFPVSLGGWRVRPSVAMRETFYSRSRTTPLPGQSPLESTMPLNRADAEVQLEIRPPVLEKTFDTGLVKKLLRHDVKHTIAPEFTYRYAGGVGNFINVLRFDDVDVMSDTNEMEYGVTQRLYLRRNGDRPCHAADAVANATEVLGPTEGAAGDAGEPIVFGATGEPGAPVCGNREWISWHVAQKYFFNEGFGGAIQNGPRAILTTTLGFSGIAFLTRPRDISPVISRLRVRTSEKLDVEWDFDYDTCSAPAGVTAGPSNVCVKKFTASNVFVDVHQGNAFGGVSYAWLNAPARSYVEGALSSVAEFSQMRILLGWGKPTKAGLSVAANAGLDLNLVNVQYGALQTSYNWNCCGLSIEYRKYELGTARNENGYKFNFTLANIGTAGNLRRAQAVF